MGRSTTSHDVRRSAALAGVAVLLHVTAVLLPLQYRGFGVPFGPALSPDAPLRLNLGILLGISLVPIAVGVGMWLLFNGREHAAGGVFLAEGIISALTGVAAPLVVNVTSRPFILGGFRLAVGGLLILAAWRFVRSDRGIPPPPPPPPPGLTP